MNHARIGTLAAAVAATALVLTSCSTTDGGAAGSDGGDEAVAITDVNIVVPADPGGGWDQTGRALSQLLTQEDIVGSAPVTNVGGAGGTVGLAQLANEKDPATLMVMGLVMVGAVETNASAVRIEDMTPIARLTDEPLVVVVPADSEYDTLEDLVEDVVDKGQEVTITGGSAGGADHILAGLLLEEAGLDGAEIAEKLNYTPNSGGGEATSLILGGKVSAGISGVGEFLQHIEAGTMKALAVSSEEPVTQLPDVDTITDSGYDVVLTNWRGVIAPGGISDAERAELERLVTELEASDAWKDELETRGWADAFLTGAEFDEFLDGNIAEVTTTLQNIGLVG
ncbi:MULTISPECIES: tripartite tricarboxylate transporter substrate-binding protein [unclassified Microbacterium]|uniref:Bug family tripartite tricarboxylate transporter substrate binding protein n=1 Tax=unclassified Microbacterium TaxID=2609290 RepID=UPI002468E58A|nr:MULTISPECIES: tripartite tricarboxylate transporter substrate-binding protein [unclassified Microbacterium]MDH5132140.1 tripartite tricarboxylate transporter substrate-binding protein [Microbacterium sp. RD10]MDH5135913.1 tripartite tricarboxylate transporter substrate-binding protein [Microbacterium sp. RD11]MDH5143889.1 tripartite tricarboxylate transporter substrate-binding protein [Microbacterium sp. RD12]MDH5153155.1 tripartite tricarboxylate transporter substrate-binding protein [Micro